MLVLHSLVFGILTFLIALYANFLWQRRRLYYLASKIDGPRGLPFIGMAHYLINKNFQQIFEFLMTLTKGFQSPVGGWLGPEFVVFADTPESLQVVLNSQHCLDKSPLYDMVLITKGLLVNKGEMWRSHRKALNPAFSIGVIQKLIPTFEEKCTKLVQNLKMEVGKEPFDVYKYVSACSLETLLKGTMDTERDVQSDPLNCEYIHNVEIASPLLMSKMLNIFYHIKPLFRMSKLYELEQKYLVNGVFKIADEIYDDKMKLLSKVNNFDDFDGTKKNEMNFINALLDPKHKFSAEEIKDEINTILAAGHETSALVISNALLMLAIHPEIQNKVVEELKVVFGNVETAVDVDLLNKLTYLEWVIKETMRLFPVLPVSARKTTGEFEIAGKIIPSGVTIVIGAFSVQRNKKYWGEDADKFRPERFEPESFKKVPSYAYIPFTGGPRLCIGWRYGMLFVKTVMVNFLRNFEASSLLKYDELEYEVTLSLKIVQHCMISVKKREF